MAGGGDAGGSYSQRVALVFIFNLIVGAGALTIPAAFSKAGLYLGTVLVVSIAFLSFMCATFVLEAMACSNALILENNDVVVEGSMLPVTGDGTNGSMSGQQSEDKVAAVLALIGGNGDEPGVEMAPVRSGRADSGMATLKHRVAADDGAGPGRDSPPDAADSDLVAQDLDDLAPLIITKRSKEPSTAVGYARCAVGSRFDMRVKVEMTVMAEQFLGHRGVVLFYWWVPMVSPEQAAPPRALPARY